MTEKILSFAQVHYPKQLGELGGGKQEGNFKTHIPALIPVAEKLMVFLGGSTLIKGESKSGNRFNLTLIWYQNRPKHCQKLTTSRILNCLAGRSELFVYQCRGIQTVDIATHITRPEKLFWYFVQPLTWNIDEVTGEVLDTAADLYIQNARDCGYQTFLYRESKLSVGCIVLLGAEYKHFDALLIAKTLASGERANPDLSSLVRPVRMPLSTSFGDTYCKFLGGDDEETLDQILKPFTTKDPVNRPKASQTPPPQDPSEVQEAINNFRVDESLFDDEDDNTRTLHRDFVVEREHREKLITELQTDNPIVLKLVGLYLFSSFNDSEDETYKVCDADQMMELAGLKNRKRNIITKHMNLLGQYVRVEWNLPTRQKATSFKIHVSPTMKEIRDSRWDVLKDPVWLGDGGGLAPIKKTLRQEQLERARASTTQYPNDFSLKVIEYLNNLPTNSFQSIINKKLDKMREAALGLDIESRGKTLGSLGEIAILPAPVYRVTSGTSRISALGRSFQNLKSSVRNNAFEGCLIADLSHFQLSVFSMLCDAQKLNNILATGNGWNILCDETGLPKPILKSIIIKGIYHKQANVTLHTPFSDIDPILIRKVMDSAALREFFEARYSYILRGFNNNNKDLFGNELQGELTQKLHVIASSYELTILEPGVTYLTNLKDEKTKLLLWLHDGYVFKCRDSKANGICNKLKILTTEQCNKFNIKTSLIIKNITIDS
jgi:hypothetical protein